MASLLNKVSIFSDGSLQVTQQAVIDPPTVQLWQHKDDIGADGVVRGCAPCPAVWPMSDHKVFITRQWQYFIRAINMGRSLQHVAALFGPSLAFCNRQKTDIRRDWLQEKDLDRPDPDFDRVRTCSLSVMTGTVAGDYLTITMMDGNNPPPLKAGRRYPMAVSQINPDDYLYHPRTHRHLFFAANISKWDDEEKVLNTVPFPNGAVYDWTGDGRPYTWLPHVSRFQVHYPLVNLKKLPAGSPAPMPYWP
jgi:hypothetical protein